MLQGGEATMAKNGETKFPCNSDLKDEMVPFANSISIIVLLLFKFYYFYVFPVPKDICVVLCVLQ